MKALLHVIPGSLAAGLPLLGIELLSRYKNIPAEVSRKLTHLLSALATVALTTFCSLNEIAIIGGIFLGILLLTRRIKFWRSLYKVKRHTWGEVVFPAGVVVAALTAPDTRSFALGMLYLGIGDTLASFLGQLYGRKHLPFLNHKTWIGSSACLAACYLIGAAFTGDFFSLQVIGLSATVTVAELLGSRGLDNILMPLSAIFLIRLTGLHI